jgi:hypothetical protein
MKTKTQLWMIFFLLILALTACQGNQEEAAEGGTVFLPQSASGSDDQGYPARSDTVPQAEGYPVQNEQPPEGESAYPVTSADLQLLNRSWYLYAYQEDGMAMDLASKTISFSGDAFEIVTDEGTLSGTWSARVDSPTPILVLDSDTEGTLFYEIITLNATNLTLQTAQDQTQILEEYMPVD